MLNEIFQDRPGNARFYACPSTVVAGDPVLVGAILPGVALETYNATKGGAVIRLSGTYALTAIAATVVSPVTGSELKEGEWVYATGTTDATTGMMTGLTLSKASAGVKFGTYDSPTSVASGVTSTSARIKLPESPA